MEIKLAKSYGFCFGVKRAIKIAEGATNAVTIGPLIHNNAEINRLKENFNVTTLHDIHEAKGAPKAIIRTHGIPKKDLEQLRADKAEVIDATCPYVTKPQEICEKMSKEGYEIVIFGDANHPEVKGVASYAIHGAIVVQSVAELENVKLKGQKVAVVSQTTRKINEFLEITHYLESRYKEVRIFNTICNATKERQEEAYDIAKRVDAMIVIGDKRSSNTQKLFEICSNACADTYYIQTLGDLNMNQLRSVETVGITAGASTPNKIIEEVQNNVRINF